MPADFDAFVLARGQALLRFAHVLCGDRHLAEDLVQEVLARVHRKWDRICAMESPEGYVRTAIVREHLSWRRRRASTETVLAELPERVAPGEAEAAVLLRAQLWDLLRELPRLQRTVLVLRYYCDLPDGEIAVLLDRAQPSIRSSAARALARLRSGLGPDQEGRGHA